MTQSLFGTDGIRGTTNKYPIDPRTILNLGMILGEHGKTVIVGKDTRLSCSMLESALISGLTSVGANVMSLGVIPTPAVAILIKSMKADLGLVISASHNPYHDNGIKIFDSLGYKLHSSEETKIEDQITKNQDYKLVTPDNLGKIKPIHDAQSKYIKHLNDQFPTNITLNGKKIVIDCANGAAYQVAPKVLQDLGAEVIPIHDQPNGLNINNQCGALYPIEMQRAVLKFRADIGISLDGDSDRVIICDEHGKIIDGEQILSTLIQDQLQGESPPIVVSNIMASISLEQHLKTQGITLLRSKVGDQHVINCMLENDCVIGGEPSGHIILAKYAHTSDGIIAALRILAIMCKQSKPASIVCNHFKPSPSLLQNINYNTEVNLQDDNIQKFISNTNQKLRPSGRLLVRKSGTEKLIRVLVEGKNIAQIKDIIHNALLLISNARQ